MAVSKVRALEAMICAALLIIASKTVAFEAAIDFSNEGEAQRRLDNALLIGSDGRWRGAIAGGEYTLENAQGEGAVRYFHFDIGSGTSKAELSVKVSAEFGTPQSGAGLLARFDPRSETYLAVLRTRDGITIYERSARGFQRKLQTSLSGVSPVEPVELRVRQTADSVEVAANDRPIARISSSRMTGSGFGLIAADTGTFRFDDFTISAE